MRERRQGQREEAGGPARAGSSGHEQPLSHRAPFLAVTWSPGDPPFSLLDLLLREPASPHEVPSRSSEKKKKESRATPAARSQKPAEVTPVCIVRAPPAAASDCRAAPAISCYVRARTHRWYRSVLSRSWQRARDRCCRFDVTRHIHKGRPKAKLPTASIPQ